MGRIKSTLIKRTSEKLLEKQIEEFSSDFEKNKKVLGRSMPSKRIRNIISGYISRLQRQKDSGNAQKSKKESEQKIMLSEADLEKAKTKHN